MGETSLASGNSTRNLQLDVIPDDVPVVPHGAAPLADILEGATQARNSFLRVVSHELRTPLTALTGYGELLADGILGPLTPLQQDTIERMRAATLQLTTMIDGVLTFSRLEAGAERVVMTWLSPMNMLQSIAATLDPTARKKGIALVVRDEELGRPLQSDEEKVRQILTNLVGNAIKFTEAGQVRLSLEDDDLEVRFVVTDTGVGIAPDDLGRLFRPFMQLDAGLTKRHGGSGLGLYISSRLAELLGGRVDVTSTPGMGSVFTLTLPHRGSAEVGGR